MKKRIVLCADDYGQALPISQGIINLLEKGRLTAVSCMTNSPSWLEHAAWLQPFRNKIDLGLHFNLTEGRALSVPYSARYGERFGSLSTVIRRAVFSRFDTLALEAELSAQIDAFVRGVGELPAFIDGHQHIHQFPSIRHALLAVYRKRFLEKKPYIRLANPTLTFADFLCNQKKVVIQLLGARALKQQLQVLAIPYNTSFSGIYDFKEAKYYADYFPNFLAESQDNGLIMCHPGLESVDPTDAIASARYHEYQYLNSEQFLSISEKADIVWGGF